MMKKEDLKGLLSTGYSLALLEVLKVRQERKKIYGDSWKSDPDWVLLAMMKMKINRLESAIIHLPEQVPAYNRIDSLIDLTNYTLFLLQNELDKDGKKET